MRAKYVAGSLALIVLLAWQAFAVHTWGAERVQGNIAACTVVASIWFVSEFIREPWWKTWFGWSLMLIAVALFLGSLATVLFRNFGDYYGRSIVLIASADIALAAMVIRTAVLKNERRKGRFDQLP